MTCMYLNRILSFVLDSILSRIPKSESGVTYVFVPRSTLHSLFDRFNYSFPPILEEPLNTTTIKTFNDTLPPPDVLSSMAIGGAYHLIVNEFSVEIFASKVLG